MKLPAASRGASLRNYAEANPPSLCRASAWFTSYQQRLSLYDASLVTESNHTDGSLKIVSWISADENLLVVQMDDRRSGVESHFIEIEAWRPSMKIDLSENSIVVSEENWALVLEVEGEKIQAEKRPDRTVRFTSSSGQLTMKALFVESGSPGHDPLVMLKGWCLTTAEP